MLHKIREFLSGGGADNAAATRGVSPAEREITPMFVDLQNYVGLAEAVSLPQLQEIMNAYFAVAADTLVAEGGTLDKFVGDVVVGMFGAPAAQADHARRGCVAALKIQAGMAALRDRCQREPEKWPAAAHHLRVRIGLHSGLAIVGNMGMKTRFNFTMMGDNVNLAARMESGTKSYGVWTLCTEVTRRACEQAAPGHILFRSLGRIIVVGRPHPLEIFEPAAFAREASDPLRECLAAFHRGLECYRAGDWAGAIERFNESAALERDQPGRDPGVRANPSTMFLARATAARQSGGKSLWFAS